MRVCILLACSGTRKSFLQVRIAFPRFANRLAGADRKRRASPGSPAESSGFACDNNCFGFFFLCFGHLPTAPAVFAQTSSLTVSSPSGTGPAQGAFQGSVPSGAPSSGPLSLSLDEALKRGLRYNLGAIDSQQSFRRAQGETIVALSPLLPNLSGNLREIDQQIDLAAFGFKFSLPPSAGFSIPTIVGPFNYFDLRGNLTEKLSDGQALRAFQSTREQQRAAELTVQ